MEKYLIKTIDTDTDIQYIYRFGEYGASVVRSKFDTHLSHFFEVANLKFFDDTPESDFELAYDEDLDAIIAGLTLSEVNEHLELIKSGKVKFG